MLVKEDSNVFGFMTPKMTPMMALYDRWQLEWSLFVDTVHGVYGERETLSCHNLVLTYCVLATILSR